MEGKKDLEFEYQQTIEDLKHLGSCKFNENISTESKYLCILGIDRNVYGCPYEKINKEYTVLLVGATKCGKSTIIDFIANFFMGICSPKNGVINITSYNIEKDAFYFYTFCTNDNSVFTFIDSPSINNDSGFIDKKRKQNFLSYIKEMKQNGIKINALGFVIQNHFVHLAPAEEGMLKFITGLLEENNIVHIIPFITFADANTPPVLDALRTFGIDTDKSLIFNNVCLNYSIKKITNLNELYWKSGLTNIQKGLDMVMKLQPLDLPDISEEDIETINNKELIIEDRKGSIRGRRGVSLNRKGSKNKFNTFAGRRTVSLKTKESKNEFSSMRRQGSLGREKETKELIKDIPDRMKKTKSSRAKGCNIL